MTSPQDETRRERLARLMDERRAELRLRWSDVAGAAGLTTEGLRGIRFGTGDIRPLTKRGIEDALQWAQGSIDAVLSGGEPTRASPSPLGPEPEPQPEEELSPFERRILREMAEHRAILEEIRAEREAERRADHRGDEPQARHG